MGDGEHSCEMQYFKRCGVYTELSMTYKTHSYFITEAASHAETARRNALEAQALADDLAAKAASAESFAAELIADKVYASRIIHPRRRS